MKLVIEPFEGRYKVRIGTSDLDMRTCFEAASIAEAQEEIKHRLDYPEEEPDEVAGAPDEGPEDVTPEDTTEDDSLRF